MHCLTKEVLEDETGASGMMRDDELRDRQHPADSKSHRRPAHLLRERLERDVDELAGCTLLPVQHLGQRGPAVKVGQESDPGQVSGGATA